MRLTRSRAGRPIVHIEWRKVHRPGWVSHFAGWYSAHLSWCLWRAFLLGGLALLFVPPVAPGRHGLLARAEVGRPARAEVLPCQFSQRQMGMLRYVVAVIDQQKIGRASCREECRSRWSPYH